MHSKYFDLHDHHKARFELCNWSGANMCTWLNYKCNFVLVTIGLARGGEGLSIDMTNA
jgi:hypothetical protein